VELIILIVVVIPIAFAVWLIVRAITAKDRIENLTHRLDKLEFELSQLKQSSAPVSPVEPPPIPMPEMVAEPIAPQEPVLIPEPPMLPPPLEEPLIPPTPAINWERFMGVKLFAWIGGLALFLGIAFFVKYSFDNNLISPELRVAMGFLAGVGLLVGGVVMSRKDFPALSQTLCATGVVVLYAVTFSCRSVYHFQFFGTIPTFLLMVLITVTACLLAVRLNALVVAILGMLGGFLTPILLSTGVDNPAGLFGYIAILDIGLILVALNRRWFFSPRWRRWAQP
jgi:uncharacterized membrane protein